MSVLKIRTDGDPILRQVASEVDPRDPAIARLAIDMIDTLLESGGVGLAAPQVAQPVRLIVLRTGPEDWHPRTYVNPTIVKSEGEQLSVEGCLSVPGRGGRVQRAYKVWVEFSTPGFPGRERVKFKGFMAVAAQHEIDHLDGVLFTDKLYSPFARRQP